ncbi:YdcF family protein [Tissierella sp. Yu-01]|uniref:YdcF family protein n=1 Tax=Tissierella sp. Yu-01 TaxID=3035694 RepID=UPI00240DDC31|nr:YdcF family protein [Tissierella sp. Yu-01]WFA09062.1 YdcF family protein [Tissierella sp. Yu-01]
MFSKNTYKIIKLLIILFLVSFILIEGLIIINGSTKTIGDVDYMIILGARLYGDVPSPALSERLKVAEEYLNNNTEIKVIVSGGQGPDEYIAEAEAMSMYLINRGIDKNRIIIEDKSTSTFENIRNSLNIIEEIDDIESPSVLLVTNKFHIFRSKLLASRLGVKAYGLPAEVPPTILIPQYIREYFAVIKSFIFDK